MDFSAKKSKNMDKYLKKVKKVSNEAKKEDEDVKKEVLYPVCPMLSRGIHKHRCIGKECVAYKNGFCSALQTKVHTTLI